MEAGCKVRAMVSCLYQGIPSYGIRYYWSQSQKDTAYACVVVWCTTNKYKQAHVY